MTRHSSFKRLVRTRMAKTGERYTAARAVLLAGEPPAEQAAVRPPLATSDAAIRERTGRGWEEWFDRLDAWGASERSHREIARWVAADLGIAPLAWNAQAITSSYERARGLRAVGEHADGFAISVQKTVGVPVERLFDAVVDEAHRAHWLPDGKLRPRTATRPRSARFDWGDDGSRVTVSFVAAKGGRGTVVVQHARLADAGAAERAKASWRTALTALAAGIEERGTDA